MFNTKYKDAGWQFSLPPGILYVRGKKTPANPIDLSLGSAPIESGEPLAYTELGAQLLSGHPTLPGGPACHSVPPAEPHAADHVRPQDEPFDQLD